MAIANFTGTTALTNYIDSEWIARQLRVAVETPFVSEQIVGMVDLSPMSTRTYAHPILSRMTAAASYGEGDEFSSTTMATVEQTIAVGMVIKSTFLTPQARGATVLDSAAAAVRNVVDAVRQKVENDTIGLSSSMSNTIGTNAQTFDLDYWNTSLTTFRAQAKSPQMAAAVLHPDAVRDLHGDLVTANAALFGSSFGPPAADATGGVRQGARAVLDGLPIFETDAVPVADTSGWGNFILEMGNNPAIMMVIKEAISLKVDSPADALGDWIAAYADYGVGIVDQNRCLQCVSRT